VKLPPCVRQFWCPRCGETDGEPLCKACGGKPKADLGWRVGWHSGDWSWFSTQEGAQAELNRIAARNR